MNGARIGDKVAGFLIVMDGNGELRLQDCDGFNNWGSVMLWQGCTVEQAADYANDCDAFKRGRSNGSNLRQREREG